MRRSDRRQFMITAAGAGSFIFLAGCSPSRVMTPESGGEKPPNVSRSVRLNVTEAMVKISRVRSRFALKGISSDQRLMRAARTHARYMGRTGKFGHEFGPDTKFLRRIAKAGFKDSAGENIGVGYRSVDAAIKGWMDSPPHRKIMLRRNFSIAGIAHATNKSGKNPHYDNFWVLILGENRGGGSGIG